MPCRRKKLDILHFSTQREAKRLELLLNMRSIFSRYNPFFHYWADVPDLVCCELRASHLIPLDSLLVRFLKQCVPFAVNEHLLSSFPCAQFIFLVCFEGQGLQFKGIYTGLMLLRHNQHIDGQCFLLIFDYRVAKLSIFFFFCLLHFVRMAIFGLKCTAIFPSIRDSIGEQSSTGSTNITWF